MKFSILNQTSAYRGFLRITKVLFQIDFFNGTRQDIQREVMERGDAVAVLLVDPLRREVILINQFHSGSALHPEPEAWYLDVVAGGMNPGESPEDVAIRETMEEVGMVATQLRLLTTYYPSPGGCNEKVFLFYGEVDANTAPDFAGCPEEHEDIQVVRLSFSDAIRALEQGKLRGAHGLIAVQYLKKIFRL